METVWRTRVPSLSSYFIVAVQVVYILYTCIKSNFWEVPTAKFNTTRYLASFQAYSLLPFVVCLYVVEFFSLCWFLVAVFVVFALQMESEKEELSQELISAKIQVAQLSMEVDDLKLRHRQETIAAEAAHAQALEEAVTPHGSMTSQTSPASAVIASPAISPSSPHTLEL